MREFKKTAGITETDVVKRMIDYGYHAPTMSWPVPGSIMLEPTESEDQIELDRFIDCMLRIREEIREIEEGKVPKDNNVLVNSPHTLKELTASEWNYPYTRELAAFPAPWIHLRGKVWSPIGRIDNVYGDKNLVLKVDPSREFI